MDLYSPLTPSDYGFILFKLFITKPINTKQSLDFRLALIKASEKFDTGAPKIEHFKASDKEISFVVHGKCKFLVVDIVSVAERQQLPLKEPAEKCFECDEHFSQSLQFKTLYPNHKGS